MRWARHQSQALATWLRFGCAGIVEVIVVVVGVVVDLGSGVGRTGLRVCPHRISLYPLAAAIKIS